MRTLPSSALLLPLCISGTLADFLGPRYPAPRDFSSDDSLVVKGWKNLTSTLSEAVEGKIDPTGNPLSAVQNITFSFGAFSLNDPKATKHQFHFTSKEIKNAPNGTHSVDADSIYRVASVTKLITSFAGMINLNESDWHRSLADIFPGLKEYAEQGAKNPVRYVEWDKVTLAALAAQSAGVPRGGYPYEDQLFPLVAQWILNPDNSTGGDVTALGLPPFNFTDPEIVPPCALNEDIGCEGEEFVTITGGDRPPIFRPWQGPAYANNGFMLLGAAIANLTGQSYEETVQGSIFKPLGMSSSASEPPKDPKKIARSVIPGDLLNAGFTSAFGVTTPSGGVFSSVNDLAKLGVGILNSTLLPDDVSRRWIKPVTHTSRLEYSMGRGWEILRYVHPESGHVTDIYTKSGDSGFYSSFLIVIPDYDAGFSILSAATDPYRTQYTAIITDLIVENYLPALEAQAQAEAAKNYAGTYVSSDKALNSSITFALNKTSGDLQLTQWISNSTDMITVSKKFFINSENGLRLLPSIQDYKNNQVAFRIAGILPPAEVVNQLGVFSKQWAVGDWYYVDGVTFGGVGVSITAFDVDDDGVATDVNLSAFKAKLKRQDSKKDD